MLFGPHGSSNQLVQEYITVSGSDHSVCFQLPFEVATYWIQHTLILIIVPFFLVSCQGMLYELSVHKVVTIIIPKYNVGGLIVVQE